MTKYTLFWKNIEIGEYIEESMDMGYLDGKFIDNGSEESKTFIEMVSKFDALSIMKNPQNGIRATLKDESGFLINVLVIGILEKMELSLKMIVGKQETIDWYLKNVPEEKSLTTKEKKFWSKLRELWS